MRLRSLFTLLLLCGILSLSFPARSQSDPVQPVLVKDINTCTESANPSMIAQTGSTLYLLAAQAELGLTLWRSDGSADGTTLVKAFGPDVSLRLYDPNLWLGDSFYFILGSGATTATYSLWASDGTEAGTRRITDVAPGITEAYPAHAVTMGGVLYLSFQQYPGDTADSELWRSDGTPDGTTRVAAYQGRQYGPYTNLAAFGGYLYFSAWDAEHGMELWRSDGTPAGTGLFLDLNPGDDSLPGNFFAADHALYFRAWHESGRWVMWRSDGSAAGTTPILTAGYSAISAKPVEINGILYFAANRTAGGQRIYRTDGTDAGTWMLKNIDASVDTGGKDLSGRGLGVVGDTLYFPAYTTELWKSDGTEAGTVLVKNLYTDYRVYNPTVFLDAGGMLYFGANDQSGDHLVLWRSDGTQSGTAMVQIGDDPTRIPYIYHGPWLLQPGQVLLSAYLHCVGGELLRIDETAARNAAARAELVKDIETKTCPSNFSDPIAYQGRVYFAANDGLTGDDLWTSDGSAEGTRLVKDLFPGAGGKLGYGSGPNPYFEAAVSGDLLFFIADNYYGQQLYRSDGTEAGTIQLTDFTVDYRLDGAHGLAPYQNKMLFFNDAAGYEALWASDGTPSGTGLVHAFGGALVKASTPVELNGGLYLLALNSSGQFQLYRSDGASAGTTLLKSWDGNGASTPGPFLRAGGRLFFTAYDAAHGRELWSSDGTAAGTKLYADLTPGAASTPFETMQLAGKELLISTWASPDWSLWKVTSAGGTVTKLMTSTRQHLEIPPNQDGRYIYFTTGYSVPRVLWRTDGTPEGTIQLSSWTGGSYDYEKGSFAVAGDRVYFNGRDAEHGSELWVSDGTPETTRLAFDLLPGPASSNPENIFFVDHALWFRADDGVHGAEPWIYDFLPEHYYLPLAGR